MLLEQAARAKLHVLRRERFDAARLLRYTLFGDTVATANMMGSTSLPMACQISIATRALLMQAGIDTVIRDSVMVSTGSS